MINYKMALITHVLSLFLLSSLALTSAQNPPVDSLYTSISPKLLVPNSKYFLHVRVDESSSTPISFTASVNSSQTENHPAVLYVSESVIVRPGETKELEIEVKDVYLYQNNLTLRGKVVKTGQEFEESSLVYKRTKTQSLLVQTDKVIYKPGEKVKFRAVVFSTKLRPIADALVNITIRDPQRNVIKFIKDVSVGKGLYSSELLLSDEPNLGEWSIVANSGPQTEYYTFTVEKYVLPKFKVEVKIPNFVTYNSSQFTAQVQAYYTYGKPIEGDVEFKMSEYSRYYRGINKVETAVKKTSLTSGSSFVEFDLKKDLNVEGVNYEKKFMILATVTDKITGRAQNGSAILRATQYPYKISMVETPENYKPGFPLTLKFKVSTQDDIPISDEDSKALKIEHGFECKAEDGVEYYPIPSNGIVNVTFMTPTNELVSSNSLKITYKNYTFTAYPPSKSTTPSKIYMDLSVGTKTAQINSDVNVTVTMNKPFSAVNYVLVGRGKVLETREVKSETPVKSLSFMVNLQRNAAPEARIMTYVLYKNEDKTEMIAESLGVSLKSELENNLNISMSNYTGEPGENVTLFLNTATDALVALRGVDQSVLLLKEDKDINLKKVEDEIKQVSSEVNSNRVWGGSESFQAFEKSGVVIFTNGGLEKPHRYNTHYDHHYPVALAGSYAGETTMLNSLKVASVPAPQSISSSSAPEIRTRKEFPETWIWETLESENSSPNTSSVRNLEKVIPDTITSWHISGYSLSPSLGMGVVGEPTKFTTFRPFFISLNTPYSVVRGEVFGLQVVVHNYMEEEGNVEVTLQNQNKDFELQEEENKFAATSTKSITVPPNQVLSLTFVIKPVNFGTVSVDVRALSKNGNSQMGGDAISRPLIVRPPGQKMRNNKAVLIDLREATMAKETLSAIFPPTRVEGADSIKFSVISDILGSTVNNLDKLLKMPTGCGEQNLVNFVPDVVILKYLEAAGTLTPAIKNKAVRYLESGYQRQLTYRHYDGSFSAFGKNDQSGSTWLTAFVVRSFLAARPYITIDEQVLVDALNFLSKKQQSDGSFVEHGTVFQHELKGGAVESLSLASYVTLAFLESTSIEKANVSFVKDKALSYLSNAPVGEISDPYTLSILTYALQVGGHEKKPIFMSALEKVAKRDGDLKYWEPVKKEKKENETEVERYTPSTKPVSVEMSSYVLLTYLAEGDLEKALPVAKWLITQRNALGGFISTQDTVVGLSALGKFATLIAAKDPNLTINLSYDGAVKETFRVNKDNGIVVQEVTIPSSVNTIVVEGEGKGTAIAQLAYSYYVEDVEKEPAFDLEISTKSDSAPKIELKVCTAYKSEKETKESNMAIMEINLPSGYIFETEDLGHLSKVEKMKRFELEEGNSKLFIYFDSLNTMKRCVEVPAVRAFKVANPAKAYVQVYDYYDTTLRAREFYEAPKVSACEICIDDKSCAIKNCV